MNMSKPKLRTWYQLTLFSAAAILCLPLLISVAVAAVKTGDEAPNFTLTSIGGKKVSLSDFKGKTVVLEWFNDGCPFVQKQYKKGNMQALQAESVERGVVWLTINSTHKEHQDYKTAVQMQKLVEVLGIRSTAVLDDSPGTVGQLYGAKTTPHMFVIDEEGKLIYQGAIDDNPDVFGNPSEDKNYVRLALDEHLKHQPLTIAETKPYGCSVKYEH